MNLTELLDTGYHRRHAVHEGEMIDAEVAAEMDCSQCGSPCEYEGWHNRAGSYIALAVCTNPLCGHEEEF